MRMMLQRHVPHMGQYADRHTTSLGAAEAAAVAAAMPGAIFRNFCATKSRVVLPRAGLCYGVTRSRNSRSALRDNEAKSAARARDGATTVSSIRSANTQ